MRHNKVQMMRQCSSSPNNAKPNVAYYTIQIYGDIFCEKALELLFSKYGKINSCGMEQANKHLQTSILSQNAYKKSLSDRKAF